MIFNIFLISYFIVTLFSKTFINIHIEEIFEEKLAKFYANAVETSTKSNQRVYHKIEKIGTPSILTYDILYGINLAIFILL